MATNLVEAQDSAIGRIDDIIGNVQRTNTLELVHPKQKKRPPRQSQIKSQDGCRRWLIAHGEQRCVDGD